MAVDESEAASAISDLLARLSVLLREPFPSRLAADRLLGELASLSPQRLLQLESRAWFTASGRHRWEQEPPVKRNGRLVGRVLARRASPEPSAEPARLREVAGLMSRDGYERQWAVGAAPDNPLVSRLLAIRTADWVEPVREAALARLQNAQPGVLIEALPIAVCIEFDRSRSRQLSSLLSGRLGAADLRGVLRHDDRLVRRFAWRRLIDRGDVSASELIQIAGNDADPMVRLTASRATESLAQLERRAVAEHFVHDAIGYVAAPALAVLVDLDAAAAITPALTSTRSALRRSARGWAVLKGIDARRVVLNQLNAAPNDRAALLALAELGDRQDRDRFDAMLDDDRAAVRAAGLRALAYVDEPAARRIALDVLISPTSGSTARVAADILRRQTPTDGEAASIESVALNPRFEPKQRLRALDLLRNRRWHYLAVALDALKIEASGGNDTQRRTLTTKIQSWPTATVNRGLNDQLRSRINQRLDLLSADQRLKLEFVLRTSS